MTQKSYVWAPGAGDGSLEPYDIDEFREYINVLFGASANGFVVPGYLNEFAITASSPVSAIVHVGTGKLMMKGAMLVNDADIPFTIAANASGNPRIDTIVAQVSWAAQEVRIVVLQGTPAAVPAPTALTQNFGVTWEIELGQVWVANGFATIADAEIHDRRLFVNVNGVGGDADQSNYVLNPEFMGWSGLNLATKATPDLWTQVGTITTYTSAAKKSQMSRGRSCSMLVGAINSGLRQQIAVQGNKIHCLRFLAAATAPAQIVLTVTSDGAVPLNITKNLRRTAFEYDYFLYFTPPSDATYVIISILNAVNTSTFNVGEVMLIPGYVPGDYRQFHETIIFEQDHLILKNHDGEATGTNKTVDVDAVDTNDLIPLGTRAFIYEIAISRISGTATAVNIFPNMSVGGTERQNRGISWTSGGFAMMTLSEIYPYRPGILWKYDLTGATSPLSLQDMKTVVMGIIT